MKCTCVYVGDFSVDMPSKASILSTQQGFLSMSVTRENQNQQQRKYGGGKKTNVRFKKAVLRVISTLKFQSLFSFKKDPTSREDGGEGEDDDDEDGTGHEINMDLIKEALFHQILTCRNCEDLEQGPCVWCIDCFRGKV